MGNVKRLTDAGVITSGAALNPDDHNVIESLTPQEVDALISVKSKLTDEFRKRHLSATAGAAPAVGIVF